MRGRWIVIGAGLGLLGVGLGAFGAHAIRGQVSDAALAIYQTGVQYHQVHALALVGLGLWEELRGQGRMSSVAGWAFTVGILVFSGTLYLLAISGERWLGAITPIGGLSLQLGWVCFALSAWPKKQAA